MSNTNISSNKSEKQIFLSSFTGGKLRKNAKKTIQKLLDCADTVFLRTQTMGLDDCFNVNDPVAMNKDDFWAWYDNEYSSMVIYLTVRDGILVKAEFSDCPYHFSDDVIMTFSLEHNHEEETEEKASKPVFTYEQVEQALVDGFISPLNHAMKHPEPTEPEPSNCRKVVSLGDYQARIEAKKERLEIRSAKAAHLSHHYYTASKERASMIPFGQPILVGHHSERRARRDADRIFTDMGKSVEAQKKADALASRAQSVGRAGIASDDPEAIEKLKVKLDNLVRSQELMKSVNKVVRSHHLSDDDKVEYLINSHGLSDATAREILKPDHLGRIGYADYALTNNNANIRNVRKRLEQLEKIHNQEPLEAKGSVNGNDWAMYEEEGRIKVVFDDKPNEDVRSLLKSNGFNWSRYSNAWVRKLTPNAIATAKYLIDRLI